jgi:heavy metal translocating P-type ATPase
MLARVLLSAMLAMAVMTLSLSLYGSLFGDGESGDPEAAAALEGLQRLGALFVSAPVMALLGLPLLEAVLRMRRWLSADALIVTGVGAAWIVSLWNTFRGGGEVYYDTATMVLVLVGLGRWLDLRARERAREELTLLLPERELPALRLIDGREEPVPVEELVRGDWVRVRPGEPIPVDGRVLEGRSFLDTASLTGESEPRSASPGDRVLAGSVLVDGSLVVEATAVGEERVCAGVVRLLDEALRRPAASVRLADRVAGSLLPAVGLLAAGTAAWHWSSLGPEGALLAALSVVLVACPCSLGIATPLAFWVALGTAWRSGVLVRGGEVLERLAGARRIWFDKTGTLTDGDLVLEEVRPTADLVAEEILRRAAALEEGSEHPIGRALRREREARGLTPLAATDFRALPGVGVEGRLEGAPWSVRKGGTDGAVRLLRGEELVGELRLSTRPRPEAREVVARLRALGLEPVVLTGDAELPSRRLAESLGLAVRHDLLPADKVEAVRSADPARAIFVGDGLNDAAALAAAGVGISVAGGSARSLDAAPVNLLRPGLEALPELVALARRAHRVARWNLVWAFGYNAVALVLAMSGHLPPIAAAGAMVASSVAVVLHSSRLAHRPDPSNRSAPRAPASGAPALPSPSASPGSLGSEPA